MNILLVGKEKAAFAVLAKRLRLERDIRLHFAGTGNAGVGLLRERDVKSMDLVVVDENLQNMTGIDYVRQLVRNNPLVNTAVIGSLPDEVFHEATEGLGVLLQLPPHPREHDAVKLLAMLRKISGLMQPESPGAENP